MRNSMDLKANISKITSNVNDLNTALKGRMGKDTSVMTYLIKG